MAPYNARICSVVEKSTGFGLLAEEIARLLGVEYDVVFRPGNCLMC